MRDEDKPFICYKQGWSMKIVPRGTAGWWAFCLWIAGFTLVLAGFLAGIASLRGENAKIAATAGFLAVTAVWALVMTRWMLARSEVVNVNELLDIKRERDRRRR